MTSHDPVDPDIEEMFRLLGLDREYLDDLPPEEFAKLRDIAEKLVAGELAGEFHRGHMLREDGVWTVLLTDEEIEQLRAAGGGSIEKRQL